jgi:CRP-like cAMP-binding protein
LLADAQRVRLPAGSTLARSGDDISSTYFPDAGVISLVREMASGRQVAVAAIGREGLLGIGPLLDQSLHTHRLVAVVDSHGYRLAIERFRHAFERSEPLRRLTLRAVGRILIEVATTAACHRLHSLHQRLARWLLITTDKAGQQSLHVTHDMLSQLVGGPRHAVTVALNDLRVAGAIENARGQIDISRRTLLIAHACECYVAGVGRLSQRG